MISVLLRCQPLWRIAVTTVKTELSEGRGGAQNHSMARAVARSGGGQVNIVNGPWGWCPWQVSLSNTVQTERSGSLDLVWATWRFRPPASVSVGASVRNDDNWKPSVSFSSAHAPKGFEPLPGNILDLKQVAWEAGGPLVFLMIKLDRRSVLLHFLTFCLSGFLFYPVTALQRVL